MGEMGESILTTLTMENNHPSTLLSMDSIGTNSPISYEDCDRELTIQCQHLMLPRPPPDINLPLSLDSLSPPQLWNLADTCDVLDVSLGHHQIYETETLVNHLPKTVVRKCNKRGDGIWGAWFFFNFYFKPVLSEKSKSKITRDSNGLSGFDKSDLWLDVFLVQHDLENMYMWVFKEKPENALGKNQLRSYMNGHSRLGEPHFPFSVGKGFVRSHRMQRKHYRGLSNPQCLHGVEIVRSPNLEMVADVDRKRWMELTGRDLNFSIPPDASDFGSWRNLHHQEFEIEKHPLPVKISHSSHSKSLLLNGSPVGLDLVTEPPIPRDGGINGCPSDIMEFSLCNKRKKDQIDEECRIPRTCTFSDGFQEALSWTNDVSGVLKLAQGPVTATKTIYEDEESYLIVVSLPFSDLQKLKVSWRNTLTHGIVKIVGVSTAWPQLIKRQQRTFKLTDPNPEHCPSGEFVREIPLMSRIPDDAKLEACCNVLGSVLEIMVPKHRVGPEEHEVRISLHPHLVPIEPPY